MTGAGKSLGHVMLVDDEEIDRRIYSRVLKRANIVDSQIGFGYAADALAHILDPDKPTVDVILLDINMPGMNGFEFLERLTALVSAGHPPLAVVIMLTTSLNPTDMARAQSFGLVRAFLTKPLDQADMENLSQELLCDAAGPDVH